MPPLIRSARAIPARFDEAFRTGRPYSAATEVRFLGAELYRPDQLFRDPGLIALYRARAPAYFSQLLEAGDVEFLQRWAMGAGMPNDILFDVLPPPYNERGLGTAMMDRYLRARGIKPPDVMRPFPATDDQVRHAGELFERHFGHLGAPEQLQQRPAPSTYDLSQYRCDEAGA